MKVFKWLAVVVGVAGLGTAGWFLFRSWLHMRSLVDAANAGRSNNLMSNPIQQVSLAFGLGILGGLLIGIGVALPNRTERSVRKQALENAADELREHANADPDAKQEHDHPQR